jgi:anti-sigma regulatory factor (Ser/Thr protein kinase)/GAF domain-containing protein
MELTISASPAQLAGLRQAARHALREVPSQIAEELVLAIDEAATNAILYGSRGGDPVQVAVWVRDDWVEATVVDHGPAQPVRPAPTTDRLSSHGRGLWLLDCLVDEVRVERVKGRQAGDAPPADPAATPTHRRWSPAFGGSRVQLRRGSVAAWNPEGPVLAMEPPVGSDPEELAATLRELARLDPVELGVEAVLERIVQAAATGCASTGGVGLLLLGPDGQLRYVVAAGRPRRSLAGTQVRLADGPSVDAFLQAAMVSSSDLAAEPRWPDFGSLALAAGIRAWLSVPVHQRHGPIGALDFARTNPGAWRRQDLAAADAYAQLLMATLRPATAQQEEQLPPALRFAVQHDTRIEQARGVIMQRERLDQAAAVELLRLQAQIEGQPVRAVAERLLARPRR